MMLVVLAGGGTGGHIYPGIAVARALSRLSAAVEFEFWGSGGALERTLYRKEDVSYRALPAAAMPRSVKSALSFPGTLYAAYRESRRHFDSLDVRAVVGLGGYSSFVPVYAAFRRGLPTVLLEQNVVPGKANKYLARRASCVCLTWEASRARMSPRAATRVTGNPLRRHIVRAAAGFSYNHNGRILVLGGSTGAVGLNSMVLEAADALSGAGREILHQTGERDFKRVRDAYAQAGVKADVTPFIDDMPGAYSSASLVIARAGGTTLAELGLFGLPSILVPYPHHKDYHQMANARVFDEAGASCIIEEEPGSGRRLGATIAELTGDQARLALMHAAAVPLGKGDAADTVAAMILGLIGGS